ncbi:MAG: CcmD family protein [Desulfonauticus sp.]|nr:CcmD family protein [Desulfonauticus sp.]
MNYVLMANIVVWLGVTFYLIFLHKQNKNTLLKISEFEELIKIAQKEDVYND